jgi:hypothetical protein
MIDLPDQGKMQGVYRTHVGAEAAPQTRLARFGLIGGV